MNFVLCPGAALSPCSPELNRIETMWRLIRHRLLEWVVDHVFAHFGNQFRMEF